MGRLQWQFFVFGLVFLHYIECSEVCSFSDVECMTKGAKHIYGILLNDIKEEGGSDPLFVDKIDGSLGDLKFKLSNITLTGLKKCEVSRLACIVEKLNCDFNLRCPLINLESNYIIKGPLGPLLLDGEGSSKFSAEDYEILFNGDYGRFVDEKDQKPHVFVKKYNIDTIPHGNLIIEVGDLVKGNKEKSALASKFFNENSKAMEKMFRKSVMDVLLTKFMNNYTEVLKTYPVDVLVPK